MALRNERPGTWILRNAGGSPEPFTLDNDNFEILNGSELKMDARISLVYDDSNLSAYRTPPEPQALVSNVGDVSVEKVSKAPKLSVKASL